MNGILLIAIALLLTNGIFAASTCGRGRLRIKFGQNKTFTSPDMTKGSCKYRINATNEMDIRLTFDEYDPSHGLSVYDGRKPFKWSRAVYLRPLPHYPRPSGFSVVYPVDTVALKLYFSPGNKPISFTYEAVIPSHGSFGYDLKAKSKPKTYRTPGYPKTLLPNFVQSTWDIIAEKDQVVYLKFLGYDIDPDIDYIEVRDGDLVIETYTGKMGRREIVENYGFSGRMTILLRIRGPNSKGFKIQYQSITPNTTEPVVIPPIVSGQPLICHRRNRLMSDDSTLTDEHTSMTCTNDDICARMIIQGSSMFASQSMTSETLQCIPRNLCTETADPCSQMYPPSGINVDSCQVTCCDTDMCNRSPDGPDVPPSPEPGASSSSSLVLWPGQEPGPRCSHESEVKAENQATLGCFGGGVPACSGVCALYRFGGNSHGNPGQGYSAMCVPESECNEEACTSIPESKYINITTCTVKCCSTDFCNRAVEPVMPLSKMPSGRQTLTCRRRYRVISNGLTLSDDYSSMTCASGEICGRMVINGTSTQLGTTMFRETLHCIPRNLCTESADPCSTMPPASDFTVKGCNVACCDTDMCNKSPDGPDVPPSPQPGDA